MAWIGVYSWRSIAPARNLQHSILKMKLTEHLTFSSRSSRKGSAQRKAIQKASDRFVSSDSASSHCYAVRRSTVLNKAARYVLRAVEVVRAPSVENRWKSLEDSVCNAKAV